MTDGENGCLYDPDQTDGLLVATRRLLEQRERHQQMRLAARREAERWGWSAATAQLRRYYKQVLEKPLVVPVAD
ncbi:MAG: hypothetical protein F4Z10_00425 [Synechococcus sp. SB0666_bin_14]|nr:hypothetical protein [Synechococcus sp. SB0666_bin_14]